MELLNDKGNDSTFEKKCASYNRFTVGRSEVVFLKQLFIIFFFIVYDTDCDNKYENAQKMTPDKDVNTDYYITTQLIGNKTESE